MACDKCHGRFHSEGARMHTIDFTGTGIDEKYSYAKASYQLCDACYADAHNYLLDFF